MTKIRLNMCNHLENINSWQVWYHIKKMYLGFFASHKLCENGETIFKLVLFFMDVFFMIEKFIMIASIQ